MTIVKRISAALDLWPRQAYVSFLVGLGDLILMAGNFAGETMIHPLVGCVVLISCVTFFAMAFMKR